VNTAKGFDYPSKNIEEDQEGMEYQEKDIKKPVYQHWEEEMMVSNLKRTFY